MDPVFGEGADGAGKGTANGQGRGASQCSLAARRRPSVDEASSVGAEIV